MKYKLWYLQTKRLNNTLYNEKLALDFSLSMEIIESTFNFDLQDVINRNNEEKAWDIIKTLVDLNNKSKIDKIGYINKATLQAGNILFNDYPNEDKAKVKMLYNLYTKEYINNIKNKIQKLEHTVNNLNEELNIVNKLKSEVLK